jgi:lipoprotein-anchoring transpeptidase ErfK/SrfK
MYRTGVSSLLDQRGEQFGSMLVGSMLDRSPAVDAGTQNDLGGYVHAGRRGGRRALLAAVPLLLFVAACQGSSHSTGSSAPTTTPSVSAAAPAGAVSSSAAPVPQPTLTVEPADDTTKVAATTPVTVTASDGTLTAVSVKDSSGSLIAGAIDASTNTWTSTGTLVPGSTYLVSATAVDALGTPTTVTSNFTTAAAAKVLGARIAPLENELVGVGMPIIIYFTSPVTDRAAVERSLSVYESIPVLGAWHWYGNEEVHYRPQNYWPTGEKVTLHANLKGVDAGNGVWGLENHSVDFTVGDSHITTVNALTHTMTVKVNGVVVKTADVSLGSTKFPTTSGTHLVLTKTPSIVMNSATVGIPKGNPNYYDETVQWDVRISWSGEFVHSAPWSVSAQGRENVSHGCVNASPTDAQWFFNLSMRGDVVIITGTPRPLVSQNGWTDWNITWAQWLAGSATGASMATGSVTAGGTGSASPLPPDPGTSLPASVAPVLAPEPSASGSASASATSTAKPSGSPSGTPKISGGPKPPVTPKPSATPSSSPSESVSPTPSHSPSPTPTH